MSAPQRLLEDPSIAPELKRDLQHCAIDTGYDAAAGLARFEQTLRATPATGAANATVSTSSRGSLALAWGIGAAALLALAAWWWMQAEHARPVPPAAVIPAAPPATQARPAEQPRASAPTTVAPPIAQPEAPSTIVRSAHPRPSDARPASAKRDTRAAAEATPPQPTEVELIARARRALVSDPALVLRLTQQLEQEYPQGMLREERDGLAVIALWRLGQRQPAQTRAEQFLASYPRSAIRARIQSILDGTHK